MPSDSLFTVLKSVILVIILGIATSKTVYFKPMTYWESIPSPVVISSMIASRPSTLKSLLAVAPQISPLYGCFS